MGRPKSNIEKKELKAAQQQRWRLKVKNDPAKKEQYINLKAKERKRQETIRKKKQCEGKNDSKLREKIREWERKRKAEQRRKKKEAEKPASATMLAQSVETNEHQAGNSRSTLWRRAQSRQKMLKRRQDDLKRKATKKNEKKKPRSKLRVALFRARKKLKNQATPSTPTNLEKGRDGNFTSPKMEQRAVKRARLSLPDTPRKRARIIEKIANSPATKAELVKKDVIVEDKDEVSVLKCIKEGVGEIMRKTKPNTKGTTAVTKHVYSTILDCVSNNAKLHNTKLRRKLADSFGLLGQLFPFQLN